VSNRIWAGKELAKLGTRPALRALREALKVEPFWGVRVQLAKVLANQKNAGIFVSEILAEVITSESDARAFMPIFNSCSSIRYVCVHACTHSHIGDPFLTQHLHCFTLCRDEVIRLALRKWIEAHPYAYRGTRRELLLSARMGSASLLSMRDQCGGFMMMMMMCLGQWAALQALGNQRNEEDLDLLAAAAAMDSPFPCTPLTSGRHVEIRLTRQHVS
jgi:hypothetical protein